MSEPSPLDGGVKEVVNNLVNDLYGFAKTQLTGAKVKILTRFTDVFKNYLEISHKRLSKVKSFFVRDESIDLSSVYVKMNLSPNRSHQEGKSIQKVGFPEVKNIKSHIIVSGSAGSGKSFLMRHLFLDCIRDGLYIPIFVELKLLKDENQSLENLIVTSINSYGGKLTFDYVDTLANLGRIFFIFDGFDEVNHILQSKISKNIKDFGEKYHKSIVILTSRPSENLLNWANFKNFNIDNLTLEQSLDLVKRLPFDPEVKSKFSQKLKAGLFEEHESFLSNPLLLSIMLLTFSQNADVPKRISIFYQQAYEALFHKHDALKEGFIRGIKTNFDIVDFGKIFSWFAIITYKTRDFSFTYERIIEILKGIKSSSQYNFDEREMLHDLTQSTSLIVEDGNLYVFTHRSFQEYFAAKYVTEIFDDKKSQLISAFCSRSLSFDRFNYLLMEMDKYSIEKYFILSEIENIFKIIEFKKDLFKSGIKLFKKIIRQVNISENGIITINLNNLSENIFHFIMFLANVYPEFVNREEDSTRKDEFTEYCKNKYKLQKTFILDEINDNKFFLLYSKYDRLFSENGLKLLIEVKKSIETRLKEQNDSISNLIL